MALSSNIIDINQWWSDSIVAFIIRKIKLISLRNETKRNERTKIVDCMSPLQVLLLARKNHLIRTANSIGGIDFMAALWIWRIKRIVHEVVLNARISFCFIRSISICIQYERMAESHELCSVCLLLMLLRQIYAQFIKVHATLNWKQPTVVQIECNHISFPRIH